jgi:hypothetical protein
MTTECRLCGADIGFEDSAEYITMAGKMIRLDVDGMGNIIGKHQCSVWRAQNRKYYPCRKCGIEMIYFDENQKSKNGRWIPISKSTGGPHQCNE